MALEIVLDAVSACIMANSLEQTLTKLLIPDNNLIQEASQELKEYFKNPAVYAALCEVACSSGNAQIRQYAAILLRRKLLKRRSWVKLPEHLRQNIKQMTLQRLVIDDEKSVRSAIASLAGIVTKHEIPYGAWPEIMQFIQDYVKSSDPGARELAMFTMTAIASGASVQLKPHFISLFNLFSVTLQDPENQMVIVYTIRTMTHLAFLIGDEEKTLVQNLLPRCIVVMKEFLMGNEDFACEVLDFFNELIESEVSTVVPNVKQIVELCLEVVATPHLREHTQIKALDFISWLSRLKKRAILKQQLVTPILNTLFPVMCRPTAEESNSENEVDLASVEDSRPSTFAAQVLTVIDVMALHFPPEKIMPPLLELIEPALQSDNPFAKRAAYIAIAVCSEGCAEYIRLKYLHALLQSVCTGIRDQNPFVRNAALFTLGQFSEYLQPDVSKYASDLLPLLFEYLAQICQFLQQNEKQPPGGVVKMFYAIEMFCENMGPGILPYLPTLIERLLMILSVAKPVAIKELAISVIGAIANAAKEELLPFFERIINHLKDYLVEDVPPDHFPLQIQAIDVLAVMARTIGSANFMPLCEESLQLGLNLIAKTHDPDLKRSTYGLFAALSFVLKEGLAEHLPMIIPIMIDSLKSSEGVETQYKPSNTLPSFELSDSDEENEEADGDTEIDLEDDDFEFEEEDEDDVTGYTVENAFQNEKEDACDAMREIAQFTPEGFMPFLQMCFTEVSSFLDYPVGSIRKVAVETLGQFCCSLHEVTTKRNSKEGREALQQYLENVIPRFVAIIFEDLDRETVIGALETISDLAKSLKGEMFRRNDFLNMVVESTFGIMSGKTACQDKDDDLDDDDSGEFEAEYDAMLIEFAGDVIVTLALALPPNKYNPLFDRFLTLITPKLKKNRTISERSFAAGVLAQSTENMKENVVPFVNKLLPIFLSAVRDEHEEVRANGIYGLGLLAEHSKDALFDQYSTVLQVLSAALARETCRRPTDNICGAVARLIMANVNGIPMDQVFPVMIKCLPLKEDFEENNTIFRCFLYLLNMRHPQMPKHFPEIFKICSHIINNKQVNEEGRDSMMQMLTIIQQTYPQEFQVISSTLPVEVIEALRGATV